MEEVIAGAAAVLMVILALVFGFKAPKKRSRTAVRHAIAEKGRMVEIEVNHANQVAEIQEIADTEDPQEYLKLSANLAREMYTGMMDEA